MVRSKRSRWSSPASTSHPRPSPVAARPPATATGVTNLPGGNDSPLMPPPLQKPRISWPILQMGNPKHCPLRYWTCIMEPLGKRKGHVSHPSHVSQCLWFRTYPPSPTRLERTLATVELDKETLDQQFGRLRGRYL